MTSGTRRVPSAEGGLVVAVEDPAERLDVEGQEVGDERGLHALLLQPLAAEEVPHDVRAIDPGQVVLVDLVRPAEAIAHLADSRLRAEGEGEEREVGLGEADTGLGAPLFLSGFDPHDRRGVRVDLAEERELDLPREEPVLLTGKAPAPGLLDVVMGELADEVTGDADVEQELARAALLVEPEGLPRPRDVEGRDSGLRGGWLLRCRGRCGGRRRGLGRGRRGRLRLEAPQPVGHRLKLLLELLDFSAQRRGIRLLGGRGRGRQDGAQQETHENQSTHGDPPR